jgi:ribosomal protein L7/L12
MIGNKITCIKQIREDHRIGLMEAKAVADSISDRVRCGTTRVW